MSIITTIWSAIIPTLPKTNINHTSAYKIEENDEMKNTEYPQTNFSKYELSINSF